MWEFIKYCVKCMIMVFASAFGYTPDEINIKDDIVGMVTMGVFVVLIIGVRFLIYFISKKFRKKKNNFYLTEDE